MNPYFEQMVLGASPIELIRLLYQRAIRAAREAREHLAAGRIPERSAATAHAYAVVAELMLSLKEEEAPELSRRLRALYCYIQQRLLEANLNQTDGPLAEVLGLLTTLSEGWMGAPAPTPVNRQGPWMTGDASSGDERLAFTA